MTVHTRTIVRMQNWFTFHVSYSNLKFILLLIYDHAYQIECENGVIEKTFRSDLINMKIE